MLLTEGVEVKLLLVLCTALFVESQNLGIYPNDAGFPGNFQIPPDDSIPNERAAFNGQPPATLPDQTSYIPSESNQQPKGRHLETEHTTKTERKISLLGSNVGLGGIPFAYGPPQSPIQYYQPMPQPGFHPIPMSYYQPGPVLHQSLVHPAAPHLVPAVIHTQPLPPHPPSSVLVQPPPAVVHHHPVIVQAHNPPRHVQNHAVDLLEKLKELLASYSHGRNSQPTENTDSDNSTHPRSEIENDADHSSSDQNNDGDQTASLGKALKARKVVQTAGVVETAIKERLGRAGAGTQSGKTFVHIPYVAHHATGGFSAGGNLALKEETVVTTIRKSKHRHDATCSGQCHNVCFNECNKHEVLAFCGSKCWRKFKKSATKGGKRLNMGVCLQTCYSILKEND